MLVCVCVCVCRTKYGSGQVRFIPDQHTIPVEMTRNPSHLKPTHLGRVGYEASNLGLSLSLSLSLSHIYHSGRVLIKICLILIIAKFNTEIIVYSRSTINACSLLSHEWWVPLIKFMVGSIIHVRGGGTHLWYSGST